MDAQGSNRSLYYTHSGKYSAPGLLTGLGIAMVAAIVLAFVYAYSIVYIPIVGYVTFILSAGFGALVGVAAAKGLELGKVRSVGVSIVVVLVAAVIGYYVSWAAWLHALLNKADVEVGFVEIITSPGDMWAAIQAINEAGSWTLKGFTPTGGVLWGLWALEAVIILGLGVFVGVAMAASSPFCERCQLWSRESPGVALLDAGPQPDQLRHHLEHNDLAAVEALGAPTDPARFYRLDLYECARCKQLNTVDAWLVSVTVNKEGERSEDTDEVCKGLLLDAQQVQAVRDLGQRVAAPAPAEPAPAEPALG